MCLPLLVLLATLAPSGAGEPILVPDFTPGTTSEFGLAFMLQDRVLAGLTQAGHMVLTSAVVASEVGALDACADVPTCPSEALVHLPARAALVVRVLRAGEAVRAEASMYKRGVAGPIATRSWSIEPGHEGAVVEAALEVVNAVFAELGPGTGDDRLAAARLIAEYERAQAPARTVADPPIPAASVPKPTRSHRGALVLDVRGGLALGDVSRAADVRVVLNADGSVAETWFQEGATEAKGTRAALYVGYAPLSWLDVGAVVGIQYGARALTSAYAQLGEPYASVGADSAVAAQFVAQPEMRLYPLPRSPVQPYVAVGGEVRVFDAYRIIDPAEVNYPEPPGGAFFGVLGGAGLLVDPTAMFGLFGEATYTYHFGLRASAAEQGSPPAEAPAPPAASGRTLGFVGGVQIRL